MNCGSNKITMELQEPSYSEDGGAGFTEKWFGIRNIIGSIQALSADERIGMDRETVYATHKFFCDSQPGLDIVETFRFRYGIRLFEIVFVDKVAERKNGHLEIDLLEIT